jgi:hypothetical protein
LTAEPIPASAWSIPARIAAVSVKGERLDVADREIPALEQVEAQHRFARA